MGIVTIPDLEPQSIPLNTMTQPINCLRCEGSNHKEEENAAHGEQDSADFIQNGIDCLPAELGLQILAAFGQVVQPGSIDNHVWHYDLPRLVSQGIRLAFFSS